ncbi:helix-turn-helix domain-containing protein [Streptomyces sp. DSM 41524]|uniref:Helix-turn-helix domain-containing protein n=1 Tax=Streptomyces asiaticus subsp. ignotus TaxID=3098222 RepID=A0ABU7Q5X7_9ACTN|nr:helix-turn-helix domain-containing protein [Streptomyces sp. DSM 41524]
MTSAGQQADESRGAFSLDTTARRAVRQGFDAFLEAWETQIGDDFPLPAFSPAMAGDYRVRTRAARVRDVAIVHAHSESAMRTADTPHGVEDRVRMYVVRRGSWTLGGSRDHGEQTVSAGQFLLRHVGRSTPFETVPHTAAMVTVLPAPPLVPLLGNRMVTGAADAAEVRLLVAHAKMVNTTVNDLGPAGVRAAHSTLIELTKAVAGGRFDDAEPLLAPALAQAAKDLAQRRLADPELSPAMLARELHVSVRTLHRAFAAVGESVAAYIRHRRLEEARLALSSPSNGVSITELAAHWQFADGSHLTRAFKARYGLTPTEYARSTDPAGRHPRS